MNPPTLDELLWLLGAAIAGLVDSRAPMRREEPGA
jgi:hypothetical protein